MDTLILGLRGFSQFVKGVSLTYAFMAVMSAAVAVLPARRLADLHIADSRRSVTVIVPCHNEGAVILQTLRAIDRLDYPGLKVIVIDDNSSDDTGEIIDSFIEGRTSHSFVKLERREPNSKKARALNEALTMVDTEFVAFFDADYCPEPDCVSRLMSRMRRTVAAVQGKVMCKGDRGLISRIVALERIAGFEVRLRAKERMGMGSQFGGTVGLIRVRDLRAVGGFTESSLTEDTDLTINLFLRGRKVAYEPTAGAYEDSPPTVRSYVLQKTRWAQGHMLCFFRYIGPVMRSDRMTLSEKLDAGFFLSYYFVNLLPGFAALATVLNLMFDVTVKNGGIAIALAFVAPFSEALVGCIRRRELRRLLMIPVLVPFYVLNVYCAWAAMFHIVTGRRIWDKTARNVCIDLEPPAPAFAREAS